MSLPRTASFWFQFFLAGFSIYGVSSLVVSSIYFAMLDHAFRAIVVCAVFFCFAGFIVALGSFAVLFVIGANRLRKCFGENAFSN